MGKRPVGAGHVTGLRGHGSLWMRTRGVVEAPGRLAVREKGELLVEFENQEAAGALSKALSDRFGDRVLLAL